MENWQKFILGLLTISSVTNILASGASKERVAKLQDEIMTLKSNEVEYIQMINDDQETISDLMKKLQVENSQKWFSDTFVLTAYCPCELCCGEWADGITSTGTTATAGRTIGVDPNVIPYGSLVIIDGQIYIAEDTGAITGNRIDVFMNTHEEALQFGRREREVYVLLPKESA